MLADLLTVVLVPLLKVMLPFEKLPPLAPIFVIVLSLSLLSVELIVIVPPDLLIEVAPVPTRVILPEDKFPLTPTFVTVLLSFAANVIVPPDLLTLTLDPPTRVILPVDRFPLVPTLVTVLADDISIVLPLLDTVVDPLSVNVTVSPEPIASAEPVFALILNEP